MTFYCLHTIYYVIFVIPAALLIFCSSGVISSSFRPFFVKKRNWLGPTRSLVINRTRNH